MATAEDGTASRSLGWVRKRRRTPASCEQCGAAFFPRYDRPGRFCGDACWHDAQTQTANARLARVCEHCGVSFVALNAQMPGRWCSRKCVEAARSAKEILAKTRDCASCGRTFIAPYNSSTLRKKPNVGRYCSLACNAAARAAASVVMNRRVCEHCGVTFVRTSGNGRFCSVACANAKSKAAATVRKTRVCEQCDAVFIMRRPSGQAIKGTYKEGRFCSRACANEAKRGRVWPECMCWVCGQSFMPRARTALEAKVCSEECRIRGGGSVRSAVSCPECNISFVPTSTMQRFCSGVCANKNYGRRHAKLDRSRKYRTPREVVDPIKVFERDGWRCYLCGYVTLKDERGTNHPFAPELEHIVPLSKGGHHTYANTACACRRCNGAKGDAVGQRV